MKPLIAIFNDRKEKKKFFLSIVSKILKMNIKQIDSH